MKTILSTISAVIFSGCAIVLITSFDDLFEPLTVFISAIFVSAAVTSAGAAIEDTELAELIADFFADDEVND